MSSKLDLEFTLVSLDLPPRRHLLQSTHLMTATLLWPRIGIAKKTTEQEVRLKKGRCDKADAPWNERILFKESVEGSFALAVSLTVSVMRQHLRTFRRALAGYALTAAGSAVDDFGPAGEVAELPLKAMAKVVNNASKEPELFAQGAIDLDATQFANGDSPQLVTVKLYSALELMKVQRRIAQVPQVGTATIAVRKL